MVGSLPGGLQGFAQRHVPRGRRPSHRRHQRRMPAAAGLSAAEMVDRPMYEFVAGEPLMTRRQWAAALARQRFTGEGKMARADGSTVRVQWGASAELVTGRRLILVVALSVSGRGSARSCGWWRWVVRG